MAVALTAGVGLAATNGLAAADTVTGDVAVDGCNVRLWSEVQLEGDLVSISSGSFSTTFVVTERDSGGIEPIENVYDIDVGDAGATTSSFDVTCDISNRSTSTVVAAIAVDGLFEQLSSGSRAAGERCGGGDGSVESANIVGNDGVNFTIFNETIGDCNDKLGRISMRIGIS